MPGKKPGPSIKRPNTYEALRKEGMSKSRAARISNAQARRAESCGAVGARLHVRECLAGGGGERLTLSE